MKLWLKRPIKSRAIFVMAMLTALAATAPIFAVPATPAEVRVGAGDVRNETNGPFEGIHFTLKVMGAALADATSLRCIVDKAVDDTGKDVRNKFVTRFEDCHSNQTNIATIFLHLGKPAPKALFVKEFSGTAEVFVPSRDTNSRIVLDKFRTYAGKPLQSPGLKTTKLEIVILTKKQYDDRKKADNKADEQLIRYFDYLFKDKGAENSVAFRLKNAGSRLVAVEFAEANGKKIPFSSWTGTNAYRYYDFNEPLPATARATIFVATDKALLKAPFTLNNVPIP